MFEGVVERQVLASSLSAKVCFNMKWITALLTNLVLASLVHAATIKADHPESYVVKEGDTLWDIANLFLEDPWLWPEIWLVNPQVPNPHSIYPGDELTLVYFDGKPALNVDRPVKLSPTTAKEGDTKSSSRHKRTIGPDGTEKLQPKIREESLDAIVPAVPLDRVQSFLVNHRVVMAEDLKTAPYVVAGPDKRIIMGDGDRVYGRGPFGDGKAFGVYRQGEIFTDPDTNEYLGTEAMEQGHARMIVQSQGADNVATLELTHVNSEIRIGDRFLSTEDRRVDANFHPKPPQARIDGKVIHIFETMNASQFDVIVINRGSKDTIEVGTVLALFKRGESIRDDLTQELVTLPPERVGLGMVFRTFERVSYVLVLESTRPISALDVASNP